MEEKLVISILINFLLFVVILFGVIFKEKKYKNGVIVGKYKSFDKPNGTVHHYSFEVLFTKRNRAKTKVIIVPEEVFMIFNVNDPIIL